MSFASGAIRRMTIGRGSDQEYSRITLAVIVLRAGLRWCYQFEGIEYLTVDTFVAILTGDVDEVPDGEFR
jgi:hypothetical protein